MNGTRPTRHPGKEHIMFVIYHITSTMQVGPVGGQPHSSWAKPYKTFAAALRTANKFNALRRTFIDGQEVYGPGSYGVAHVDHYRTRVVRKVERTNLISGQKYLEDSNTPGYCSPASEAYWSM